MQDSPCSSGGVDRVLNLSNNFLLKCLTSSDTQIYKIIKKHFYSTINYNSKKNSILTKSIYNVIPYEYLIYKSDIPYIYNFDLDVILSSIEVDLDFGYKVKISKNPNDLIKEKIYENDAISIYTDGSKDPKSKSVGTACFSGDLNISKCNSLSPLASIYTAESIAINDALSIAIENKHKNINVFTDSLSVIQSLRFPHINTKINPYILKIKQKIKLFYENNNSTKIKFFWIPSHIGIEGNEEADRLAKLSTLNEPSNLSIPFTDITNIFRKYSNNLTNQSLMHDSQTKGKQYFQYFYKQSTKPWFHKYKLKRDLIVTTNRCRSDHYNLNASLFKIKVINQPNCECGHELQDLDHILWQCPLFDAQRDELL